MRQNRRKVARLIHSALFAEFGVLHFESFVSRIPILEDVPDILATQVVLREHVLADQFGQYAGYDDVE